jgi:hypothetical protein
VLWCSGHPNNPFATLVLGRDAGHLGDWSTSTRASSCRKAGLPAEGLRSESSDVQAP